MQNYRIGSGLSNLGNTCFFNAVIQSILHTQSLAQYFSTNQHSSTCKSSNWCIMCSLENLWQVSKKNRVSSPMSIVNNLKTVFKKFRLGRQEDSHQFLRYLVEGMQEIQTGKLGKDRQKNQQKIVMTKTFKVFGGRMRNCVLCYNCGYKSLTSERYYELNIECQKSNSLGEGISNFFRPDELKGINKYYCQKCQTQSNALKSAHLITSPDVLTIQFKRFTNSLRKIGKLIQYPKYLNIGKYFEDPVENFRLELYAFIVHAGYSSGSGHYYAFVKWNGEWYQMNDSHVSKCSEQKAMNQQAYILFYKRLTSKSVLRKDSGIFQEEKKQIQQVKDQKKINSIEEVQVHQMNGKAKEKKQQPVIQEKKDDEEFNLKSLQLKRRRSKQEAISEMTIQQMLLKYSEHLFHLSTKIPSRGKRHRSFTPVYNLRKYEMMIKRRKIQ